MTWYIAPLLFACVQDFINSSMGMRLQKIFTA
jgi:hypothetical protein